MFNSTAIATPNAAHGLFPRLVDATGRLTHNYRPSGFATRNEACEMDDYGSSLEINDHGVPEIGDTCTLELFPGGGGVVGSVESVDSHCNGRVTVVIFFL